MFKIKCDINQQYLKTVDLHFIKSEQFSFTWSCGSRQRDTTSSKWKFRLNNMAVKGLIHINFGSTCVAGTVYIRFTHPFHTKLAYFNFYPPEVVSRYRDPQLQVGENYTYLFNLGPNICKYWCLGTYFIPNNSGLTCQYYK